MRCLLFRPHALAISIVPSGHGIFLMTLLVTTLPVSRSKYFNDPCLLPDRPNAIQPCVRGVLLFVTILSVVACTYEPKVALQSRLYSTPLPVTSSRGDNPLSNPESNRIALNYKVIICTVCMSTIIGIGLNGKSDVAARTRSLIVLIRRSISGTCSRAAVVLTSTSGSSSLTFQVPYPQA